MNGVGHIGRGGAGQPPARGAIGYIRGGRQARGRRERGDE